MKFQKIPIQSVTQEINFDSCSGKLPKINVKYSIEKPILLNFVNLSTIVCARLELQSQNVTGIS